MTVGVAGVAAIQEAIGDGGRVLAVGGQTKPALSSAPGAAPLDVSGLRGILAYDSRELTITALAGTPVAEIADALAEHGQELPFDPPLAAAGATLGGVVAAGTSGPGAFAHGGVRDFVIGVRFVDGRGRLVAGGGNVVKNAAGFDLPKLMVGSCGRLGVIVELTLKVFPAATELTTAVLDAADLAAALGAIDRLGRSGLALEALDLEPPGRVLARLRGPRATRAARVAAAAGLPVAALLDGAAEREAWHAAAELAWIAGDERAVRVALAPRAVPELHRALTATGARARYSLGGNVAWVAWPAAVPLDMLGDLLRDRGCWGSPLTGRPGPIVLGAQTGGAFGARIRAALDPHSRFPEL